MGIYLICLIVGGGDHDMGGHNGADHPGAGDIASWFSLRALVSFATFFGLGGLAVGGFTAYLFRLARTRGEVSGGTGKLAGRTGDVLISPAPGRPGRVA
ncbi:hypothetical protein [Deinococcus arenicola]|uniref:DUF1206 domain-containing protein n=1 Tax=Deinococcus arenicola TaxID=2994950 RepID=A0ABU4DS46_9DEIO|nr:hypothetical protein [Deinococcus sp. ZS9-10]MDV6375255.1 hypothetical protein [Deinococcus sp. ZS9-10]